MRISIGCDHRGIGFKQSVIKIITDTGHSCEDLGSYTADSVDYPDIAQKVADVVVGGKADLGVLICSTGIGMCIAANKVKGIRAALCHNSFGARRSRQHNDANVLCLGADEEGQQVPEIIDTFLNTDFEGGRHQRRVDKMSTMES